MTTTELKQRIADWIRVSDDPAYPAAYIQILRDCLKHIEELEKFKTRLEWLHSGGGQNDRDPEGYEWGVARVKFDENGKPVSVLWTDRDHRDLDAEIERTKGMKDTFTHTDKSYEALAAKCAELDAALARANALIGSQADANDKLVQSLNAQLRDREVAISQLVKAINEAYGECDCGGECDLCQLKQRISKIIP